MMKLASVETLNKRAKADLLVLPFYQKGGKVQLASSFSSFTKWAKTPLELGDFKAKSGELFMLYPEGEKEKRLLLLGLGKWSELNLESLRRAYAQLVKLCHEHAFKKANILFPEFDKLTLDSKVKAVSEGLLLSNYVFDQLKGESTPKQVVLESCTFVGLKDSSKRLLNLTETICEGVNLARDLVNENADTMNAEKLGEVAKQLERDFQKVSTVIFDKKRLEKEKLNLILTVNRGAATDPSLIMVHYRGNPHQEESTVLIGKGVTYDSGGLQIKPRSGSIIHMKCDMGGAATVLGVLHATARLDLPLNVIGVIPACENAVSDRSYKPGDVYNSYLGKTVEIVNTDAEGRLILADALAYAEKNLKPKHMIDLATLTGGVVAALGDSVTGLMTNHPKLAKKLIQSGEKSGEPLWELPLYEDYKVALKSSLADLKNTSTQTGYPAAIVAGLFLQEFVQSTPWVHLDIAGTAYLNEPKHYHSTKATGVGVRLILAFLEDLINSQEEF